MRLPTLGISIGVSSIAEIQIDGISYQTLGVTERAEAPLSSQLNFTGDTTSDMDDIVIGAKVRVLSETDRRPAVALRFATRLPNASNESGLGLDTIDFVNTLLVGKTIHSVRVVGNVGLGILSDPTRGDRQNDVLVLWPVDGEGHDRNDADRRRDRRSARTLDAARPTGDRQPHRLFGRGGGIPVVRFVLMPRSSPV